MKGLAILFLLSFLMTACATNKDMYYWGAYQKILYEMNVKPGSVDALAQIEKLTSDIEQADANGLPVAPGVYAHLGMMYASNGDLPLAKAAFTKEKNLYPESSVLVDGMLERSEKIKEGSE